MKIRDGARILALLVAVTPTGCATTRHLVCPHDGGPTWRMVTTGHVAVITDLPRNASVVVARNAEAWAVGSDRLLSHFLPDQREPPTTAIVMFAEHWEYADLVPAGTGEFGSTVPGRNGLEIVVASADRAPSYVFAFARTRQLLAQRLGKLPSWLELGLSEYFAQIERSADGRRALGGLPASLRMFVQKHGPADTLDPVPFAELFTGNEPTLGTRWQLSTWVLVHYLANGAPDHGDRFRRFLRSVADGTPPLDAISKEYGPRDEVEAAYRAHPRSFVEHKLLRWIFEPEPAGVETQAPILAELGDVLPHLVRIMLRPSTRARELMMLEAHVADEKAAREESRELPPVFPFGPEYGHDYSGGLPQPPKSPGVP